MYIEKSMNIKFVFNKKKNIIKERRTVEILRSLAVQLVKRILLSSKGKLIQILLLLRIFATAYGFA